MATKTKSKTAQPQLLDAEQRDREMLTQAAKILAAFRETGQPITLKLGPKQSVKLPGSAAKAIERACRAELDEEMTTQEAADYLNVSRPYIIKLLDEGKIPYRLVGAHRRVVRGELFEFHERNREDRRAILNDLIVDAEDLRLYNRPAIRPKP